MMGDLLRILGFRPQVEPAHVKRFRDAKEKLESELQRHDVFGSFVRQAKGPKPTRRKKTVVTR